MGTEPDHYAALGINRDATPEEIRRAYHRKARKLHPDVNEETGATELFLDIQYAYEVLSDPAQRLEYEPSANCDKSVGHQRDQQVALNLHVDLFKNPHSVFFMG